MKAVDLQQPTAAQPAPLTESEVEEFHRDGYLIVRGLADATLRAEMLEATREDLARHIGPLEYEAELRYPGAPSSIDAEGGRTVRRLKQAHARHPAFTEWVRRPELVNRLRQLLGEEVVMPLAHHNCIMTKQPRYSSDTGWHRDIRYWSFARPELISVWTALTREEPENGGLKVIPGSQQYALEAQQLDDAMFFRDDVPENRPLIESAVDVALEPGDVLFFHCRLLHAANRNRAEDPKFSAVFTFRPADNPPTPGTRSASLPELIFPPGA